MIALVEQDEPDYTAEEFDQQRRPRFGVANPELVDVPFWNQQIRTGDNAWTGLRRAMGEDADGFTDGPTWTFERFGATATRLPDGRVVAIAGEHEDWYDPDFHIYNDVIVFGPNGEQDVYLYPPEVFPPTDFHATVWAEPYLYMVGNLGRPEHRNDARPLVHRLDSRTWQIEPFASRGPLHAAFHRCLASYDADRHAIRVIGGLWYEPGQREATHNSQEYWLDLATAQWNEGATVGALPIGPEGPAFRDRFNAVRGLRQAYDLIDQLRRSLDPWHPMYGEELMPLYQGGDQALFRFVRQPDRFVVCDLDDRRSGTPLKYRIIEGGEAGLYLAIDDPQTFGAWGRFELGA